MQFATLFLIASAALALSNGDRSNNAGKLAKKEAAPDGGFHFPTEDEDDPNSPNYRFRPDNDETPQEQNNNNNNNNDHPLKNKTDKYGIPCRLYAKENVDGVPEECLKSVFCRNDVANYMLCDPVPFTKDNWTREKLIKESVDKDCVHSAICKEEDYYWA